MERIMDEGADHSERYVKKYQYNKKWLTTLHRKQP